VIAIYEHPSFFGLLSATKEKSFYDVDTWSMSSNFLIASNAISANSMTELALRERPLKRSPMEVASASLEMI
jgi:hypothetical protein